MYQERENLDDVVLAIYLERARLDGSNTTFACFGCRAPLAENINEILRACIGFGDASIPH